MIAGLIALLITIILGILIFYTIANSIPIEGEAANDSFNKTMDTAGVVFNLLPIIAVVAVAGVLLAVILGFGGAGSGRRT